MTAKERQAVKIKKQLIEAMKASGGVISTACEIAGVSRQTYYNYINDDDDFREVVEQIEDEKLDFAQSQLMTLIKGFKKKDDDGNELDEYDVLPCKSSIFFFLKTKGKHLGFVERTEHMHGDIPEQEFFPDEDYGKSDEEE